MRTETSDTEISKGGFYEKGRRGGSPIFSFRARTIDGTGEKRNAHERRHADKERFDADRWNDDGQDERHDLLERIEGDIRAAVPSATVFTHLEPIGDPAAWQDISLDRADDVTGGKRH